MNYVYYVVDPNRSFFAVVHIHMHKFKHPLTLIFLSQNLHRKTFRLKNYNNELYTNFMPGQIKKT